MPRPSLAALVTLALCASAFAEVKVGEAAPDFTLKDQDGKDVKLSDFKGQKHVVIAFYPKDDSKGCTTELTTFVTEFKKLRQRDVTILAISSDSVESHCTFASKLGAPYKLLSDPGLATAKVYDVVSQQPEGPRAARSVFLVDKDGNVRWLDRSYKVPIKTLEGNDLLVEIEKVAAKADPVAALAALPPAERDGKTVFVRFAQAMLLENAQALDALLHEEACGKPGEAPQMQQARRKQLLDKWRGLFEKNDFHSVKFEAAGGRPRARRNTNEQATNKPLASVGADAHAMAERLADGEIMVVGRTTAPKAGEVTVLAKEVVLRLRKSGNDWKIVEVAPQPI
jgi:peroxiredoxin Q/BCP